MFRIFNRAESKQRQTEPPARDSDHGRQDNGLALLLIVSIVVSFFASALVTGYIPICLNKGKESQAIALTRQRLNRWYPRVDGPNAASLYQQAYCAYVDRADEGEFDSLTIADIMNWPDELPRDQAERLQAYVAGQARAITLLERAAEIKQCRFMVEVACNGDLYLCYHHDAMRRVSKLLYLAAVSECDRGQTDRACRRVMQITRIADALFEEPTLLAVYHSYNIRSIAGNLAERLLRCGRLSDDNLAMLHQALLVGDGWVPRWLRELGADGCNTKVVRRLSQKYEDQTRTIRTRVDDELNRRVDMQTWHLSRVGETRSAVTARRFGCRNTIR